MIDKLFSAAEHKMQKAVEITRKDLATIRTGRASPSLLDKVQVDYYGAPTPINALASIAVPEPRMIVIQPWERGMIGAIEKAILKSDLGLNPSSDGTAIRLIVPQLTEQRRKDLVKSVHRRAEEGRVAIRNIRRDSLEELKKLEKDKQVSEDEAKRAHERLDKLAHQYIAQVDEVGQRKEQEVLEV
ncbi:MAG: ribosome recycling factor [Chloroflexi bacterium]|nr:ribosome recycling factor [Chloroflexota bacterium]